MTAAADWSRVADPARRVGRSVEFHAEIGSTNDRARAALREPGGEGLAVVADLQTAGRGRRGRSWVSPAGVNLTVSVGIRPLLDPSHAGLLGIAAALATRDACAALAPDAKLAIRWPNDVVTARGAKIAGLLLETAVEDGRLTEAVIGIGINVNWRRSEMPAEIAARATSLADVAGRELDRTALLAFLLDALDAELAALERGASPVDRFRSVSMLDGRRVVVELGEELLAGIAAGIADDGALLLDTDAGRVALTIGEVISVRDAVRAEVPA
ncbi:MAG TPA: biotin--[acetyl-CoA-carboxylase] ligase [Candidatus Dormibacteraeota bacterium]|nr:biotin--[acetyl-CoA-carboxylase] ligase [Candidatus Dormibacteraeota bacterium]